MVYCVTKIFGIDAVKTKIYKDRNKAEENILKWIKVIAPEGTEIKKYEKENGEVVYPIFLSSDPTECIIFILKPCEIR